MRPKVKILVAVWGDAYIERFTALALSSFLAPGNLPAVAVHADLEFLVMTSKGGIEFLEARPAFRYLRQVCQARFVLIDDLIGSGAYGVSLTLAYMRGIATAGDDMVNTHFVFLNSDFILADGSLKTLVQQILAGHRCILAPSFRAVAEEVEPLLESAVDRNTGTLTMSPRDLVRVALRHLHPTTIARTVNQHFFRSTHPNQLYWHVDENTLLARFYLIFMLCIRPERVVKTINSYCDYGFVPEMCPSGDITVLTDSDEFFMLETQRRLQEIDHVRMGKVDRDDIVRSLLEWTTREHRLSATYNLVFHSEDVPPNLAELEAEADRYVKEISTRLGPPKDHAFHYYWVAGVEGWRQHLRQRGLPGDAPEIAPTDLSRSKSLNFRARALQAMYAVVLGVRPFVRIWHHDWCDYHIIGREVHRILSRREARILLVGEAQNPIAAYFPPGDRRITRMDRRSLHSDSEIDPMESGGFDNAVCILSFDDLRAAGNELVERVLQRVRGDGELLLVMHNARSDVPVSDITDDLTRLPLFLLSEASVSFSGGAVKALMRQTFHRLVRGFYRHGIKSTLVIGPPLVGVFVVNFLNNMYALLFRTAHNPVPYCTTLILRLQRHVSRLDPMLQHSQAEAKSADSQRRAARALEPGA